MMPDIFGKLSAAVLAALLLLAPVAPAAAWDEVCVKFPLGAGYAGHFNLIHGFAPRDDGRMPGRAIGEGLMGNSRYSPEEAGSRMDEILSHLDELDYLDDLVGNEYDENDAGRRDTERLLSELGEPLTWIPDLVHNAPRDAFADGGRPARGVIRSGPIRVPNTGCVSIRDIPSDDHFYVMVYADKKPGRRHVICSTHSSNPNWWYRNRPNRWTQKIEFNARGSLFSPRCEYSKEY